MRLRAALAGAVTGAALLAVPGAARAASCVTVVVDYGTMAGAPAGPDSRCVPGGEGDAAASFLAGRARYSSSGFLCAIDGYPESGCGDHGTEPYWSFWLWRHGTWEYSSQGVASYAAEDADGDGCLDALGFRYHAFKERLAPRAAPPACPKPATAPPRTTAPPAPGGGTTASTAPATRSTTGHHASNAATSAPAAPGATASPTAAPATATATPGATVVAAPTGDPLPVPAAPSPGVATPRGEAARHGLPLGTLLAVAAVLALAGGAAWQVRRRRTP
ncbi:MAG TPA: hypothetical protein VFQ85_00085 [Mycobacteriales bacterium]|jgi:hypothetical protein|nr:hypothetical protein [Mycobacteriales bacterium]